MKKQIKDERATSSDRVSSSTRSTGRDILMKKLLILPAILLFAFITSAFVVSEGQNGIVMQFSKVKRDSEGEPVVYPPGLHFKVPFIDSIRIMDTRIQTLR